MFLATVKKTNELVLCEEIGHGAWWKHWKGLFCYALNPCRLVQLWHTYKACFPQIDLIQYLGQALLLILPWFFSSVEKLSREHAFIRIPYLF